MEPQDEAVITLLAALQRLQGALHRLSAIRIIYMIYRPSLYSPELSLWANLSTSNRSDATFRVNLGVISTQG